VLFAVPALPQPPESLAVLAVTFDEVKLVWNATGNATTAPIKSYLVLYRVNGSSSDYVEVSVLKPEIVISGLNAHTAYEFRVHAVSDVGRSLSAAAVVVSTSRTGTSSYHVKWNSDVKTRFSLQPAIVLPVIKTLLLLKQTLITMAQA